VSQSKALAFFDQHFAPKLAGRGPTMRAVFVEMLTREHPRIIETGSLRRAGNWRGDGQSTLVWDLLARDIGAHVTSIDIDANVIATAGAATTHIRYIHDDSIATLRNQSGSVDLLYLDSFDVDPKNPMPAAMHQMFEFTAAVHLLTPRTIVLLDDCMTHEDGNIVGKGMLLTRYLRHVGAQIFAQGALQIAWQRCVVPTA
jgi:hypothetical protein